MTTVYLIDIADFKRKTLLSQNLNTDRLKAEIALTQEQFLVKELCQDLYDQIISQYPDSLSVANTALLPYIQDYLVFKSWSRYLVSANLVSGPQGLRVMRDSTADKPESQEMLAVQRQAQSDANFYQDKLINFLIKNEDTYTLWRDSICNCSPNRRPVNGNRFSKVGSQRSEKPIHWT